MFRGAGVLPYAIHRGNVWFLLGLENEGTDKTRNNLYSDFGGGKEKGETPEETAYREFVEESMNAIGNNNKIKMALKNPPIVYKNKGYYEYLIKIKYDNSLTKTYNRILSELGRCMVDKRYKGHTHKSIVSCPVGLVEKVKFKWFKPDEIIKNKKRMRPVFYDTFTGILNKYNIPY